MTNFFWRKDPPNRGVAIAFVLISILFFSAVPFAIKGVQWTGVDLKLTLLPITGIKSLASAILMIALIGPKNFQWKIQSKSQFAAIFFRICVNLGWVGVLSTLMPSGTAVVFFFTYPFFTLIISWWTGEKLSSLDFLGMILSTLGVTACVFSEIESAGLLSITIALLTAVANGYFLFFASKIKPPNDRTSTIIWTEIICSLFILPIFWIDELPSTSSWSSMILSGVLMGLGMHILSKAMNKLQSHETAQFMLFQPLGTIFIGIFALGEVISLGVYAGGAMILAGCFLRFMPQRQKLNGSI